MRTPKVSRSIEKEYSVLFEKGLTTVEQRHLRQRQRTTGLAFSASSNSIITVVVNALAVGLGRDMNETGRNLDFAVLSILLC